MKESGFAVERSPEPTLLPHHPMVYTHREPKMTLPTAMGSKPTAH
ncbi:MAG: hypothetical protein ACFBSF_19685 [Leptolyngbyaceae cyanobacterium]